MKFIIGDKHIDRISGPISMYVMTSINKEELPHVIMFGDDHTDSLYQCLDCTCEHNESCCMKIYDSDFFVNLSEYSKENNCEIDIYIEAMVENVSEINDKKFLDQISSLTFEKETSILTQVSVNYMGCLLKTIKKKNPQQYSKICKAPNLNWYGNDVRQINFDLKSETKILESLITKFWDCRLLGFIFLFKNLKLEKCQLDYYINKMISTCRGLDQLVMLCDLMIKFYNIKYIDEFFRLLFSQDKIKSFIVEKIPLEKREYWLKLIIKIVHDMNNDTFYKRLNEELDMTELRKIEEFKEYVQHVFSIWASFINMFKLYVIDNNEENYLLLSQAILDILSLVNVNLYKQIYNDKYINKKDIKLDLADSMFFYQTKSIRQVHFIYSSFFMDIVNLYRITTTKNKICMIYNGHEHCMILRQLLDRFYNYKDRVKIDPTEDTMKLRCVDLSHYEFKDAPGILDLSIHNMLFL